MKPNETIIICAFVLDLIFGDPYWLPHPICFIGKMISFLEKKIRIFLKNELFGGVLLSIIVILVSFALPFFILYLANKINFYLALIVEIYFVFQILATKSMKTESMKVYNPLIQNDIQNARKYLSFIVGRDTENLDGKGVIRATVETVAENTTDAVIAPLLFIALGGAPLGFLYKAINTMDSMIGYKNENFIRFGKFAARLDDVANFIPARLSALLMIISAFILGLDGKNAIKIFLRDRKNHKSPNSAQTESVCAGALNVQLAGDAYYFGELTKKSTIGDNTKEIQPKDIILANRLMVVTSVLGVLIIVIVRGILWD